MSNPTSIDLALEKHWSALSIFDRASLLRDLGVTGKVKSQEPFLEGRSMDQIISGSQDDLPGLVRGRLICAITPEGFSVVEYERVRDLMMSSSGQERLGN